MLLEFAASLVLWREAFAAPKIEGPVITVTQFRISLKINELVRTNEVMRRLDDKNPGKMECRTMHIQCTVMPKPGNTKPMAGFGQPWAR